MPRVLLKWSLVVVGAAFGVLLLGYIGVWAVTHSFIYSATGAVPETQAAMVLGASVDPDGTLSPVLQERADEAIALYKAHKVLKILVSGDNAASNYDEVGPVRRYLLSAGIPPADIFLDHAGFDTYSSMYRARAIFDITSLTIVSQPFHLPRAVFIARHLGIDAYGAQAGEGELYIYYSLREVPAFIKAFYDVETNRVPEYLGSQFPITGDGEKTWY
jgi:SanA protein